MYGIPTPILNRNAKSTALEDFEKNYGLELPHFYHNSSAGFEGDDSHLAGFRDTVPDELEAHRPSNLFDQELRFSRAREVEEAQFLNKMKDMRRNMFTAMETYFRKLQTIRPEADAATIQTMDSISTKNPELGDKLQASVRTKVEQRSAEQNRARELLF
jgi:hypothetical protein